MHLVGVIIILIFFGEPAEGRCVERPSLEVREFHSHMELGVFLVCLFTSFLVTDFSFV